MHPCQARGDVIPHAVLRHRQVLREHQPCRTQDCCWSLAVRWRPSSFAARKYTGVRGERVGLAARILR
eukprot:151428-Pyramimonas_sp.AAC.1